ncbi:MAG: o-succinylbenzoate synthase [Gemmatimonadota bacterium]
MRIERISLRAVRLRLTEPFRISSGETFHRRILLLSMDTDAATGNAECVAGEAPNYSYETNETARWALENWLIPAVLGLDFQQPAQVAAALESAARGHKMAKAAIEMAAWDASARARGESLAHALGGDRARVPAGVSIGLQPDRTTLFRRIRQFVEEGYQRVKLKIAPGHDVNVVRAVRKEFPDLPLTVDANAAYVADDLERLCELDGLGLLLIEQPFAEDDLLLHAELQRRIETPVCLDESITSPARCREAIALQAGRMVNIKPGRVGGHGSSLAIHDLCREAGWPVWIGGMLESGIGRAHNVALASLPNVLLPGDTSASRRYWERDVVQPEFTLNDDGTVSVPTAPGIGVGVDEAFLEEIEESRREFVA